MDDGSCIQKVLGRIDKEALNFDENANIDDGSCEYKKEEPSNDENIQEQDSITSESQRSNRQNTGKKEKEGTQTDDSGSAIVSLGILGGVGYFVVKRRKNKKREQGA